MARNFSRTCPSFLPPADDMQNPNADDIGERVKAFVLNPETESYSPWVPVNDPNAFNPWNNEHLSGLYCSLWQKVSDNEKEKEVHDGEGGS